MLSMATVPLPPAVSEITDLLAVKCNLCENTGLNPPSATKPAYSCEENCPTGALLRVNPREYFAEAGSGIGLVYRDTTHAIGRNIHRKDSVARWWHIAGGIITVLLTALAVWLALRHGLDGRLRGTWLTVRWITGLIGLVGIAAAMTFPRRKRIYRRRAGPLRYWMLAHIYAGVAAGLLLLLHGGRNVGGLLTTSLMISFDLVIATGLFGLACFILVPRLLTKIEGEPLLLEDLETRRDELRGTLGEMRIGKTALATMIEAQVVPHFFSLSGLLRQFTRREPLTDALATARSEFRSVIDQFPVRADRDQLIEAVETCVMLRRTDALIYLHRLLKAWLAPHIISTSLMLVLMLIHIVQVVYFAVR
jgi:hypothetical protein